ncbi:potassium channel subfamily T member 2-like isoform X2 [Anneissia japonica]|uniref:potassium channel subfamily T member 2-like isoform X2 n=1 Tax=Anneissia japonica TaxID=1529436 RepID=UPI001425874E|nr:potassium channel subfamily T member 2-like isoform X2 [Anneissia japonica]
MCDANCQRVHVEYFVNEQSIKERLHLYFIKNQRSTLRIRLINCFFKLLTVVLYLVRAIADDEPKAAGKHCFNIVADSCKSTAEKCIYWPAILCVDREDWMYGLQCALAIINLLQVLLLLFLNYKGNILQQIMSVSMVLEAITSIPFVITIVYPPSHDLFVPVFLNCWLAKELLENLFNDLHRVMQRHHSALTQQVFILIVTILCLIITCACGIHHLERAGQSDMSVFEALYFTVVTFSTVGYGDIKVEIWPSQLFVILMIAAALVVLPVQMEKMALLLIEKQKQGGTYSNHRARTEKHVVVCASMLHYDLVNDFLNEFYAHAHLQDFFVVLLTPCELEPTVKWLLQVPLWSQRVIYIQGSALKDIDLVRCRMDQAEACFILSPRNKMDRIEAALLKNWKRKKRLSEKLESIINRSYRDRADQQTILRTWAVKDFAPNIPLYVQIMKPENKFHVQFADHVVCEDEFKYALLANNCLCPATSTFVTLLIHTSRGVEGETASSQWQKIYGRCSGNEIYHIQLKQSQFFGEYEGKSFTFATFNAHKKYGVSLIGIKRQDCNADLQLNPGPKHILKDTDTCYYMNITKEEYSAFILAHPREEKEKLEKKDSKSSSPTVGDPNVSKLESAICSVGTLALEMHHYGPNNSTGESPEKQRTEPTGQENPGNATYHFDDDVESHFSYDLDHDDDDDSNSGGGTLPIEMREQNNHPTYERSTLQVPSGDRHLLMPPPAGEENVSSDAPPIGARRQRRPSIMPVSEMIMADNSPLRDHKPLYAHKEVQDESEDTWEEGEKWTKGYPPVMPYIGYSPMMCHLLETPKPHCCLELDKPCDHKSWTHAGEYNWPNNNIIIAAEYAAQGMVNFIVPLRAHFRPKHTLKPIIIMVEKSVDNNFLECISSFPMVYFMIGLLESLDDLLRAGMLQSDTVVVVDRESSKLAEEDYMADANQIVAVQTMFRLFPSTTIITELTHAANMRFMQFRAKDFYALRMAEKQKLEKEKGSNISYMFRLPFAAGNVFSASMLDTMLYQSFVKDYAISIVRLLLGLDQATNSGYLCELPITPEDLWIRTYGRLYQKLCSTSHEIPIGIYRTVGQADNKSECSLPMEDDDSLQGFSGERKELANMVRIKMKKLDLPEEEYDSEVSDKRNKISYVIINPSFDMKLEVDDIIYLIKPAGGPKTPSPMPPRRKFSSRRKTTHQRFRAEPQGSNVDTKL